jgi:hypothetical protein
MDSKVHTVSWEHRNREKGATFITGRTVWIYSVRTVQFWHKFRGGNNNCTQSVQYGFTQSVQPLYCTEIEACCCV